MLINSSELCTAGFKLKEVLALHHLRQLLACAREERDCEVLRVWVLKKQKIQGGVSGTPQDDEDENSV